MGAGEWRHAEWHRGRRWTACRAESGHSQPGAPGESQARQSRTVERRERVWTWRDRERMSRRERKREKRVE